MNNHSKGDGDVWMLSEEIPSMDFHMISIPLYSVVNSLTKTGGRNARKIMTIHHGPDLAMYFGEQDLKSYEEELVEKLVQNPAYGQKINTQIRRLSEQLKARVKDFNANMFERASLSDLGLLYAQAVQDHIAVYEWGWLPNMTDNFHGTFTTYLMEFLKQRLPDDQVNPSLVALSTSHHKSMIQEENESFLKLVAVRQQGKSQEAFEQLLQRHADTYFYLKHLWMGLHGVYDLDYYREQVEHFIQSGEKAESFLEKEGNVFKQTLNQRQKIIKNLKLNQKEVNLFDVYADFAVTKAIRRDAQIFWSYKLSFLLEEIAKRFNLTLNQVRCMHPDEIKLALKLGRVSSKLKQELTKREVYCIHYAEPGIDEVLYDTEARLLEESVTKQKHEVVNELHGRVACLGYAKGAAKIINTPADMHKMNKGDVLVSISTNPDIVPAMKKASAIITETGGVTSHAAIVSRELHTPCVISVKNLTKAVQDNDIVEVDADRGIIKIIQRAGA